jgi:predicted outer membrane repeat protein
VSIPLDPEGEPWVRFANCVFDGNTTRGSGGAVVLQGTEFVVSGKASFTSCNFARNVAHAEGGAIACESNATLPALSLLRSCIVWDNRAHVGPQLAGANRVERSIV